MQIILPQSVQDYFTRNDIRKAVDFLLKQDIDYFPKNLEWGDLRAFQKSVLAAQIVRTDYVVLLIDAWDAIWKPALQKHLVQQSVSIDDLAMEDNNAKPSTNIIWNNKTYQSAHCHPNKGSSVIWTFISYNSLETGFRIGISIWKKSSSMLCAETNFGELWRHDNEEIFDGWFSTREGVFPFELESNVFDSSEIGKAAESALQIALEI